MPHTLPVSPQTAADTNASDSYVTLTDHESGRSWQLPRLKGSAGPDVIDIRQLYHQSGLFTYDPGYASTASCQSAITFIDGENGILLYRGYNIEDIAHKTDFPEICYLLFHGELPTKKQINDFRHTLTYRSMVHDQIHYFYRGFRRDAHPMAVLVGVLGAMSSFYSVKNKDFTTPEGRSLAAVRLLAKMPTVAAMAYKYAIGQPFAYPQNRLGYAENFLYMMFSNPCEPYQPTTNQVKAMEQLLILHADHEQNASTSTVRLAGSSGTNPFACIASGIASLWGPAHGGANEAVLRMLEVIETRDNIPAFIKKARDKNDPFRLMGFGHRVYKNYDPRATVIRDVCMEVIHEMKGRRPKLLDLALELEEIALKDSYFVEKKLFPNIDFYSGILLRALGFPTTMFTAFFAVARTAGWVAQWREMIEDDSYRIGRPRQLYRGHCARPFVPLANRS